MGVKIIKEGSVNKNKIYQFTCLKCGCVWEADESEFGGGFLGGNWNYGGQPFMICPCCDATVMSDGVVPEYGSYGDSTTGGNVEQITWNGTSTLCSLSSKGADEYERIF